MSVERAEQARGRARTVVRRNQCAAAADETSRARAFPLQQPCPKCAVVVGGCGSQATPSKCWLAIGRKSHNTKIQSVLHRLEKAGRVCVCSISKCTIACGERVHQNHNGSTGCSVAFIARTSVRGQGKTCTSAVSQRFFSSADSAVDSATLASSFLERFLRSRSRCFAT